MKDSWFNQHLAGATSVPPFSFTYDGQTGGIHEHRHDSFHQ